MGVNKNRNKPCHCGSGKKYKKCCGNYASKSSIRKSYLETFNFSSIIRIVSALSLQKENQSRFYRLALLAFDCLKESNVEGINATNNDVIGILNEHYGETNHIWTQEDPHEVLFTDALTFAGIGTMPVYTNLQENLVGSLRLLTETVYNGADDQLHDVQSETIGIITTLLAKSWAISKHNMHGLYELGESRVRQAMSIESEELLEVAIESPFLLSNHELDEADKLLFEECFVLIPESFQITITEYDTDLPFFRKPFFKVAEGYMLIFPSTLIECLQNFILDRIIQSKKVDYFNAKYLQTLKSRTHDQFHYMGWQRNTIHGVKDLEIESPYMLYQLDSDIFCQVYCMTLAPDLIKEGISPPYQFMPQAEDLVSEEISLKVNENVGAVMFSMIVVDVLGQPYNMFPMIEQGNEMYFSKIEELEYLALEIGDDSLQLLKFLRIEVKPDLNFFGGNRIDRLSLYKEKKHSFYFHDDTVMNMINLDYGYGNELKREIKTKYAKKFMSFDDEKLIEVVNRYKNSKISIFRNVNSHFDVAFLVQGYHPHIWVTWDPESHAKDIYQLSELLIDSISFWTWRISKAMFQKFHITERSMITIKLEIDYNRQTWNKEYTECEINTDDIYNLYIEGDAITIEILEPFRKILHSGKNFNDRILIRAILEGMCHTKLINLDSNQIYEMIETIAPVSYKTMINHPYLLEEFIRNDTFGKSRPIKCADAEYVLDNTIRICDISNTPREIVLLKDRKKLCNDIVSGLFNEFKKTISLYSTSDLLKFFINNYEATQRDIQKEKGRMHSYLECFNDVVNVKKELVESLQSMDMTRLLNRTIIEIIAAIQPEGEGKCSIMKMDYIIALMASILRYANMSDEYLCKLHDDGMAILPSGRIGTNKSFGEDIHNKYVLDSFYDQANQVIKENLGTSDRHVNEINDSNQMRQAFIKEFGFSYEELKIVVNHIWAMIIETESCYSIINLEQISQRTKELEADRVKIIVDELCYKSRDPWHKNPDSSRYKPYDIYPWRYNRRYSLYSKPLILLKDGSIVAMQRHLMLSLSYLNTSLADGSFRGRTEQMIRAMSKVAVTKGKSFCNHLFGILTKDVNEDRVTRKEFKFSVLKKDYEDISMLKKLGDIDILIIDSSINLILSVECKNTIQAKNSYQLHQQVLKIEGGKWIEHHEGRHEWLTHNKDVLSKYFQMELSDFTVKSFFVTPTVLPYAYFKKLPDSITYLHANDFVKHIKDLAIRN